MSEASRARKLHEFYLSGLKESTYRALLSEKALSVLEEIGSDEEYAGSGDPKTLSLLTTLIDTSQMSSVLQIGTWIGFSTVAIAGALARTERQTCPKLVTVDPALPQMDRAKSYVARADLKDYVEFVFGSSLEPSVQERVRELGPYDLVFIDSQHDYEVASKELKAFWPCVKDGGVLAAHDSSKSAAGYDTKQQGGVIRALVEWIESENIDQYLFLTPPLWNPVGLFIAFKIPQNERPLTHRPVRDADCSLTAIAGDRVQHSSTIPNRMRDRELVLQVNAQAASEQYRVHNVAEQLDLAGVPHKALTIQQLHDSPEKGNRLFDESTLIIFHRVAYDSLLDRLCTRARKRGTTLVYETDDLIFFPNIDPCWIDGLRYLDHTEVSRYYEGVERYKRMLELCDAGLFSTGFLASIARKMGVRRTWVLRNALGNVFMDASERVCDERKHHHGNARVRLGYCSGTKTHNRDFTVFAPTLLRLMEDDPRLDLEILGHLELPAQFQHFGARVRQHKPVSWEHYLRVYVPQFLSAFDINLAPLEFRNPFCRAKSELKYFEAGILGIPTIASRTEEFAYAIESGKTGFLVNDDRELEDCLRKLASHRDLRIRVGAAAREDVLLRYSPLSRSRDLLEILREITGKELSKRSLEAHVN